MRDCLVLSSNLRQNVGGRHSPSHVRTNLHVGESQRRMLTEKLSLKIWNNVDCCVNARNRIFSPSPLSNRNYSKEVDGTLFSNNDHCIQR